MSHPVFTVVVCVALVDQNKNILLGQRPKNKAFGGFFEFPGGKVMSDESPHQALSREIEEELGLKIDNQKLLYAKTHIYAQQPLLILFYVARVQTPLPLKMLAHDQLVWTTFHLLEDFLLLPANQELLISLDHYLQEHYE